MIATKVFYFVARKQVAFQFTGQNYILSISYDKEMASLKGIDKIMDNLDDNKFCHQ